MGEVKPVPPSDIIENLDKIIPSVVIEAVNNLLKLKYRGLEVTIKQKEIMDEITRLDNTITSGMVYENKWMDFEPIFRKSGWVVEYDKAAYNENYDDFFKFKSKTKKRSENDDIK